MCYDTLSPRCCVLFFTRLRSITILFVVRVVSLFSYVLLSYESLSLLLLPLMCCCCCRSCVAAAVSTAGPSGMCRTPAQHVDCDSCPPVRPLYSLSCSCRRSSPYCYCCCFCLCCVDCFCRRARYSLLLCCCCTMLLLPRLCKYLVILSPRTTPRSPTLPFRSAKLQTIRAFLHFQVRMCSTWHDTFEC